jgi:hypothetical protein
MDVMLRMCGVYRTTTVRGHAAAARQAALASCFFSTLSFARLRASTGHFLHLDFDRQHFFLTLPAFVHLRT